MTKHFNLADMFEMVADKVPARSALVCGEQRASFGEQGTGVDFARLDDPGPAQDVHRVERAVIVIRRAHLVDLLAEGSD